MSTKINLEFPYAKDWKSGYLNTNSEGRKTLVLYNSPTHRSSTQYARYLLAVSLGRYLTDDEEADHIDEDKTNDSLDNLRVLTKQEHRAKNVAILVGVCPECNKSFERTKSQLRPKCKQDKLLKGELCCSRSCGAKKAHKTRVTG